MEILFLAVNKEDKNLNKGLGTYIMDELRDLCIQHNITKILVHADKNAVRFFEKKGFARVKDNKDKELSVE